MSPLTRAQRNKDTEDILGLMLDAVEDYSIYMLDIDGTVMTWNSGAQRNKGYTASEIIGCNYSRFFPREAIQAGDPQKELDDARTTGRVRTEGWRVRKDGTKFWAVVTLTAVRDKTGSLIGFAKVARDLSDRREQEAALRAALEEAKAANATKSAFLANMSHELRTPLNAIIGFSEMIISEIAGPSTPKNRDYAGHIHSSGHHLLSLINDLLDFAKLDANAMTLNLEKVDVRRLAQEAIDIIQPLASKAGVHTVMEISESIPLHCDVRRMLQIFLNLLSNAVKFTDDGGRVILRARRSDGVVLIEVEDTGIGMEMEEIPRALIRFGQIDSLIARKYAGTGLGLPLVRQLVELHGGTFALTSAKGVGTKVVLTIPKDATRTERQPSAC